MAKKKSKAAKNPLKDLDKSDKKKRKKTKQASPEDDIDKILADLKIDQQRKNKVVEEHQAPAPTRRANATFLPHPHNTNELVLFGGEHYDNQRVFMYNDLFRYKIDKNEWTRVTSPNSPGPRSSHQLVASSTGLLFLFGGEFVSPNEANFFHYRDFWSFDLKLNIWAKLECKLQPSPRSGHRMIQYKQFILLFGGFYDVGSEVRYYDDFWCFDCQRRVWKKLEHSNGPSARSGFQICIHNDYLYLYGGYSKLSKGRNAKGVAHSDLFSIKLNSEFKSLKWERQKKTGSPPNARCGMAPVYSKGRLILFGGVTDLEEVEDGIKSICHDDMYNKLYVIVTFRYNLAIEANRWFPFTLKQKKTGAVEYAKPCQRFNAMTLVVKNTLYLFGGVVEAGSKEYTLGDLWSLQLDKLVQWVCVVEDEAIAAIDWVAEESEHESDNDSIDTDEESDIDSDGAESTGETDSDEEEAQTEVPEEQETPSDTEDREKEKALEFQRVIDANITPARGEKLGPYFTRTIVHWEEQAFKREFNTGKILRTKAFDLAKIGFAEFVEAMGELESGEEEEQGDLQVRHQKDKEAGTFRPRR